MDKKLQELEKIHKGKVQYLSDLQRAVEKTKTECIFIEGQIALIKELIEKKEEKK